LVLFKNLFVIIRFKDLSIHQIILQSIFIKLCTKNNQKRSSCL